MSGEPVRASVLLAQGQRASAEILDLTVTEDGVHMRLGFAAGEEVVLPVGRAAQLTLESDMLGTTRTYSARILRRHEQHDVQIYEATLDAALGFELELTVLPRGAVRVRPKIGERVEVSLVHPGVSRKERFPLIDASLTGLSLLAPCATERALYKDRNLKLQLHLPGQATGQAPEQAAEQALVGRIRSRVLAADGGGIEYGVELDPGSDSDSDSGPAAGGAALAAWVERRYAELISGMRTLHRSA